ncbi:MAG: RHS repeat-associated core domain-containing protein, partial [Chlamydiota bacterium]
GLVDPTTKKLAAKYTCTAFGEELSSHELFFNPWRYASKRLDPETNLIYFGKRYYDPALARWLTTDPAGFIDSTNLYQYVYNNPFRYTDPNGEHAIVITLLIWGAEALFPSLTAMATAAIYATAAATVSYIGYKAIEFANYYDARSSSYDSSWPPTNSMWGSIENLEVPSKVYRKQQIDERLPKQPDDLLENPEWEEISHEDAKEKGHRTFQNAQTGEKLRYDEGKSGEFGNRGESHWHRYNPNSTSRHDEYLDVNNMPAPRNSPESHLYSSE